MNISTELFDLIKSINSITRLRIKKILSTGKSDKKKLLLFNLIEKQDVFDDAALQSKLGFPKWYSWIKNSLYEFVINNLSNEISEKKSEAYILKLIMLSDILQSKGLIDQAQKRLEQARAICSKYDWPDYVPLITHRLGNIIINKGEEIENSDHYLLHHDAVNQFYRKNKYISLFWLLIYSGNKSDQIGLFKKFKIAKLLSDEKYLQGYSRANA